MGNKRWTYTRTIATVNSKKNNLDFCVFNFFVTVCIFSEWKSTEKEYE